MSMETPDLGNEVVVEPSGFRQLIGRVTLVGALAASTGGAMAACAPGGANTSPVNHGEHVTVPARQALSDETQLSVHDETRMRHDIELVAELRFFLSSIKPRINYDPAFWYGLHHCEQADTWHAGGHFKNGLLSGGNGLGMSADAWRIGVRAAAGRGVTLPASGWDANIDQQMQVAQAFLDKRGWGWGCPRPAP